MKRPEQGNPRRSTAIRGFTLVELLTVIAIIVLLIGILVPAVNKVRDRAKETSTRSALSALETGLESFRADQRIGGSYPPSASDWRTTNNRLTYRVESPYTLLNNGPTGQFDISGAGLLVWSLVGADLNGCPGFKTFRTNRTYWAEDTTDIPTETPPGAYALKINTYEPYHPRVAPMIDMSRIEVSKWNGNAVNGGSFEIPREIENSATAGLNANQYPQRLYPMFLDSFGGPILYWRADPTGIQAVDESPNFIGTAPNQRTSLGIYHFRDNGSLLMPLSGQGGQQPQLILNPRNASKPHRLRWLPATAPVGGGPAPDAQLDGFWAYVRNKAVQSRVAPYRPESYLLISAGVDGIFGTADDIANFEHNGAELTDPQ